MKKERLLIQRAYEKEKIDKETGEVISEYKHDSIVVGSPGEFYQVYASIVGLIEEVKPMDIKVFVATWRFANSANKFALTKSLKEEIAERNKIGLSTVNNSITNLVNMGLLIRIDRATYRINPRYFWKSSRANRKKTLKYVLEFECKDC